MTTKTSNRQSAKAPKPPVAMAQHELRRAANLATVREAAEITGVDDCVLRHALKRGWLKPAAWRPCATSRSGRCVLLDLEDVEAMPRKGDRGRAMLRAHRAGAGDHDIAVEFGIRERSVRTMLLRLGAKAKRHWSRHKLRITYKKGRP